MPRSYTALVLSVFALVLFVSEVQAATITGVTIEDVSSQLAGFNRLAPYVLDGSGLVGAGHGTTPDGTMWLSQGTFGGNVGIHDPLPAQITFDLGDRYALNSMRIWNYNEAGNFRFRGVNQVELLAAEMVGGPFVSYGNINVPVASGVAGDLGTLFNLAALDLGEVRLLRFNILSNHGGDTQFAGLSEVRFDGQLVPEPATLTLWMLMGVVLIVGCVWQRRHRRTLSAAS